MRERQQQQEAVQTHLSKVTNIPIAEIDKRMEADNMRMHWWISIDDLQMAAFRCGIVLNRSATQNVAQELAAASEHFHPEDSAGQSENWWEIDSDDELWLTASTLKYSSNGSHESQMRSDG